MQNSGLNNVRLSTGNNMAMSPLIGNSPMMGMGQMQNLGVNTNRSMLMNPQMSPMIAGNRTGNLNSNQMAPDMNNINMNFTGKSPGLGAVGQFGPQFANFNPTSIDQHNLQPSNLNPSFSQSNLNRNLAMQSNINAQPIMNQMGQPMQTNMNQSAQSNLNPMGQSVQGNGGQQLQSNLNQTGQTPISTNRPNQFRTFENTQHQRLNERASFDLVLQKYLEQRGLQMSQIPPSIDCFLLFHFVVQAGGYEQVLKLLTRLRHRTSGCK